MPCGDAGFGAGCHVVLGIHGGRRGECAEGTSKMDGAANVGLVGGLEIYD
jgi:hypothetical protein